MIETIEEAPKTHSIVTEECVLRVNHKGMQVTYRDVSGWLIRYITSCEHRLLTLTLDEVRECVALNTPEDTLT